MWKVAFVCFLFTWTLTTHGKFSASGDEPHYLMIAQSLVADHDLDLGNNYAQNDGRLFGHDGLAAELHALPSRTGRERPIHDIGLAVAIAPAYVLARAAATLPTDAQLRRFRMTRGLFVYSIVGLFLIAMAAAGLRLVAIGLNSIAGPREAALLAMTAGISPPIVSHAFLVFPEVAALCITCIVVWFSLKVSEPQDSSTFIVIVLLLGALPWVHHKYLIYVPGLLFLVCHARWALVRELSRGDKAAAIALFMIPQLTLHAWTLREWGTLGGSLTTGGTPFTLEMLKSGSVGLWIDRQSGLLAYAPIYWMVPVCWCLTWKRTWPYLVPAVLLFVPAAAYVVGWWAGFAPAARYLVPAMPLFLVPIAYALHMKWVRWTAYALLVPQAAIDVVVWQHPRWLWPQDSGANPALEALGSAGRAYEALLPSIRTEGLTFPAVAIVAVIISIVAAALLFAPPDEEVRPWPPDDEVARA